MKQVQKMSNVENLVYIKAMTETLIEKNKDLNDFLDKNFMQLGLYEETPLHQISVDNKQASQLISSYLERYAQLDEVHHQLKHYVTRLNSTSLKLDDDQVNSDSEVNLDDLPFTPSSSPIFIPSSENYDVNSPQSRDA